MCALSPVDVYVTCVSLAGRSQLVCKHGVDVVGEWVCGVDVCGVHVLRGWVNVC